MKKAYYFPYFSHFTIGWWKLSHEVCSLDVHLGITLLDKILKCAIHHIFLGHSRSYG